ncbi:MAG: fused MFS/spermidine synthase [Acidobacteriota bacterium]
MLPRLAPALFFLSGVAGLVLQVAWFRLLAQSLGGTLAATTAVLTAYMAGLALGARLFADRGGRGRAGVVLFGWLEVFAGVAALLTLPLIWLLDEVYALVAGPLQDHGSLLLLCKLFLACLILMPATTCMGGTLPVLCQSLSRRASLSGTGAGGLYALNTLGAMLGVLIALFVLLPRWGLTSSVLIGAAIDLAVGLFVIGMARLGRRSPEDGTSGPADERPPAGESEPDDEVPELERGATRPARPGRLAAALFVVGLCGLAYEVLWTRILVFYFGSGAHAFGVTLMVVLAGLALGGFLGGHVADRTGRPLLVFSLSQAALVPVIAYQIWWIPRLPDFLVTVAQRVGERLTHEQVVFVLFLGALQWLLPAALLQGVALPAAVRAVVKSRGQTGAVVGRLAAASTAGAIPGAVIASHVLVPVFGTQGSLLAVAALGLTVAVLGLVELGAFRVRSWIAVAAGVVMLVVVSGTFDQQRVFAASGVFAQSMSGGIAQESEFPGQADELSNVLLRLDELAHGTVSLTRIVDGRGAWLSLSIDGVNVAGTSPPLLSCQTLQGQLPLLLHERPERVLHVGFGSGGTAAAVASHPEVKEIHVAEINPTIPESSTRDFAAVNFRVMDDPRVKLWLADGRNFVLGSRERFDVILSDSAHPRYSGQANLYTVDYFELCRSKLRDGGLVSTWLPIYSLSQDSLAAIVASMREVFPATSLWYLNSTVNEYVVLIGRLDDGPFDLARFVEAMSVSTVRENLANVGLTEPAQVLDFFVAEGAELDEFIGDAPLHFDDRPWVEFESARTMSRAVSWRNNLKRVIAARHSVGPHLEGADAAFLEKMERFEAATTLQLQGQLGMLDAVPLESVQALFQRAIDLNPADPEPWEVFGYPDWVERLAGPSQRTTSTSTE